MSGTLVGKESHGMVTGIAASMLTGTAAGTLTGMAADMVTGTVAGAVTDTVAGILAGIENNAGISAGQKIMEAELA